MQVSVSAPDTPVVEAVAGDAVAAEDIIAQADAAVAIAEIQADRDVAVAEIAADVASEGQEDDQWLREQLDALLENLLAHRTVMETLPPMIVQLTEALTTLTSLLQPPTPSAPPPPESDLTESGPAGPRESPEAPETAVAAPESETPKRRRAWL